MEQEKNQEQHLVESFLTQNKLTYKDAETGFIQMIINDLYSKTEPDKDGVIDTIPPFDYGAFFKSF